MTVWRQKLSAIGGRVCRVEVPFTDGRRVHGTAFLVGPDLALTNYHVMRPVLDGEVQAADVTLRFDYRVYAAALDDLNQARLDDGLALV